MKHFTIALLTLFAGIFVSCCKEKPEVFSELQAEKSEAVLATNQSQTLKITSGSGEYTATSANEKIAKATVSKDIVTLAGIAAGETTVTVADSKSKQTVQIKVTVNHEETMAFASAQVVEFKKIAPDGSAQDIAKEKTTEYWGKRIADNTPAQLQFKNDSLYIVKPGNMVEKYKTEWRGKELFLHNKPTDTWRYCGAKTTGNGFLLNTGFYSVESKTPKRTLRVAGQSYTLRTYSEIGNYPNPEGIWLRMQMEYSKQEDK